jgi:hypothetical protein
VDRGRDSVYGPCPGWTIGQGSQALYESSKHHERQAKGTQGEVQPWHARYPRNGTVRVFHLSSLTIKTGTARKHPYWYGRDQGMLLLERKRADRDDGLP